MAVKPIPEGYHSVTPYLIVDKQVAQAVAAGGTLKRPVANQFYGDRTGGIDDPFGIHWYLATHVEDVAPDELERRAKKAMAEHGD